MSLHWPGDKPADLTAPAADPASPRATPDPPPGHVALSPDYVALPYEAVAAAHQRPAAPPSRLGQLAMVGLSCLAVGVVIGLAIPRDSTESPSAQIPQQATVDDTVAVEHLQVGDCVLEVLVEGVPTLPEVPCAAPHWGEVVGRFTPTGDYPGHLELPPGTQERCRQLFEAYAPARARDPRFQSYFVLATEEQWADPDYRMTCLATDFTTRTGSLRDAPPEPGSSPDAVT